MCVIMYTETLFFGAIVSTNYLNFFFVSLGNLILKFVMFWRKFFAYYSHQTCLFNNGEELIYSPSSGFVWKDYKRSVHVGSVLDASNMVFPDFLKCEVSCIEICNWQQSILSWQNVSYKLDVKMDLFSSIAPLRFFNYFHNCQNYQLKWN